MPLKIDSNGAVHGLGPLVASNLYDGDKLLPQGKAVLDVLIALTESIAEDDTAYSTFGATRARDMMLLKLSAGGTLGYVSDADAGTLFEQAADRFVSSVGPPDTHRPAKRR